MINLSEQDMRHVYYRSNLYFPICVGLYLATYVFYIYLPTSLQPKRNLLSEVMFGLLVLCFLAAIGFIFKPQKPAKSTLVRGKVKENAKTGKRK